MTKEELKRKMQMRMRELVHGSMSPADYVNGCVEAMFDVAAEILAEPDSLPVYATKPVE